MKILKFQIPFEKILVGILAAGLILGLGPLIFVLAILILFLEEK